MTDISRMRMCLYISQRPMWWLYHTGLRPRVELPKDVMDALAGIAEALARVHELEAELAGHAGPQGADDLGAGLE